MADGFTPAPGVRETPGEGAALSGGRKEAPRTFCFLTGQGLIDS